MQKLRQYLAKIVDTEQRQHAVRAARLALVDINDPRGLPELALQLADTNGAHRLNSLLMEAYNAQ